MRLSGKTIDALAESDLQSLIDSGIAENRIVEYKAALPGRTDSDKREFVRDVVSLANSTGGHIIYGMVASGGIPTELRGIPIELIDEEKLRLEQIARTGIEPIIHGLKIESVPLANAGGNALVVEIPRALFGPHMIRGRGTFIGRNSAGKMEMDFGEIRAAFVGAETAVNRIREFYSERIGRIVAGDALVPLRNRTLAVLHVLPLESFTPGFRCDLSRIARVDSKKNLEPRRSSGGWNARFSLDGFMQLLTVGGNDGTHCAYAHAVRNGALEYVESDLQTGHGPNVLRVARFECMMLGITSRFLRVLKELEVRGPFFAFPSLLNVRGWNLMLPDRPHFESEKRIIDREHLILPEVVLETDSTDLESSFRPSFDVLWNACGWSRSHSYDENGVFQHSDERLRWEALEMS